VIVHLCERDCTVQRRHQKVVERAPAPYLDEETAGRDLCGYAVAIARAAHYVGAGTVEFLMDAETGSFYFIEVHPRVRSSTRVTGRWTGIDIVKAQIPHCRGRRIWHGPGVGRAQQRHRLNAHALQCRITTEDPEQNFSRLRPHHRLPRRHRLRHPPRRRTAIGRP